MGGESNYAILDFLILRETKAEYSWAHTLNFKRVDFNKLRAMISKILCQENLILYKKKLKIEPVAEKKEEIKRTNENNSTYSVYEDGLLDLFLIAFRADYCWGSDSKNAQQDNRFQGTSE